jgi:hypothetical protein
MSKTASGMEIDTEYYKRFTILVESFDNLPDHLQAERASLIEAGRRQDQHTIRETLPAFCENAAAMHRKKVNIDGRQHRKSP